MIRRSVLLLALLTAGALATQPPTALATGPCDGLHLCEGTLTTSAGCGGNETVQGETCAYGASAHLADASGLGAGELEARSGIATGHVYGQNAYNDWAQDEHALRLAGPAAANVTAHGYASQQDPASDRRAVQAERHVGVEAAGEHVWLDLQARVYAGELHTCRLQTSLALPATECSALDPQAALQGAETFVAGLLP